VATPVLVLRWMRIEVRRRWRSLILLTLLVAISGGTVMASTAGARRGASALERLQKNSLPATAVVFANTPNFDWDRIRALPEVENLTTFAVRYSFFFDGISHHIGIGGRSLDTSLTGAFAPVDDRVLRTVEKPVVLSGRVFDPARDDEVVVTPGFVKHIGKGVGDTLTLTLPSPAEVRRGVDRTRPDLSGPRITMHIVGVIRSPWFSDAADSPGGAVLSPGLVTQHPENTIGAAANLANPGWINALVRLRHGESDLQRFRTDLAEATRRADIQVWNLPQRLAQQQHEIAFEARCLLAFGAAVLIAALFVIGQAMARYTGIGVTELNALRGPGMTRGEQIVLASAAPVAAAALGSVLAGAAAAVASRWFPIGTAAYVEPHEGVSIDWTVIGPGVALVVATVAASAAFGSWRTARRQTAPTSARRSSVAAVAARSGMPVPVLVGARFALETGSGRSAQPVRPTIIGAVAGVAGIVAALTFSTGVSDAADRPERYGQTFQLGGFIGQNGYNYYPAARIAQLLATDPNIAGVGDIRESIATGAAGQSSVSLFTMAASRKPLRIVVTSGRVPAAADEILLAPRSVASLHAALGARVTLTGDVGPATYLVTGIGFVPQGGPNQVYADGGWLSPAGYARIFAGFRFHLIALNVAPGRDPGRLAQALTDEIAAGVPTAQPLTFDVPAPPIEILELRQVRALPTLLGAFLAILAAGAIGHALATAVRRRAPELAVLRALGMTPGQCRTAVITQATVTAVIGLVFGIPLGIALGRSVWRAVADYTPLEYVTPAAAPILLLCVPLTLVLANLLAAVPGRRAARLQVVQVLRTE
jgi:FtsX-like permease family